MVFFKRAEILLGSNVSTTTEQHLVVRATSLHSARKIKFIIEWSVRLLVLQPL